jgi:hypothetical protein
MLTWDDVDRLCGRLPGATRGRAHEGSPAWYAGRHQFARLRDDEGRAMLQFWSGDMVTSEFVGERRVVFRVIHAFRYRVSVWAYLDRLDLRETAELVLDSFAIRGGARRRAAVDPAAFLPD